MNRSRAVAVTALLVLAAACTRTAGRPSGSAETQVRADSIVLERTRCYGTCPAYRLTLVRTGQVRFETRWPEDTPSGAGTISLSAFTALVDEAMRIGFWNLPDRIQGSRFCPNEATDLPSAIVTIHARGRTKSVDDYHGCFGLPELRAFEVRIDSVAGSSRWVRRPQLR